MARDAPDGVKLVSITVVVDSKPVIQVPATETLVWETYKGGPLSLYGTAILDYTVPDGVILTLVSIELETQSYDNTYWTVTIGGVSIFEDKDFPKAYSLPIPELHLAAGTQILIYAKRVDPGTIYAWADIVGKLVG